MIEALCPLDEAVPISVRQVNLEQGPNDPTKLTELEQAVELVHAGYLAIMRGRFGAEDAWQVKVPNTEVRSVVLPAVLENMYGLLCWSLSEDMAKKLAAGKIGQAMEVFAKSWSRHLVSAREDKTHLLETYLSGGLARALANLRARFPGILKFRGNILSEANGAGRLDVAFTFLQQEEGRPGVGTKEKERNASRLTWWRSRWLVTAQSRRASRLPLTRPNSRPVGTGQSSKRSASAERSLCRGSCFLALVT